LGRQIGGGDVASLGQRVRTDRASDGESDGIGRAAEVSVAEGGGRGVGSGAVAKIPETVGNGAGRGISKGDSQGLEAIGGGGTESGDGDDGPDAKQGVGAVAGVAGGEANDVAE